MALASDREVELLTAAFAQLGIKKHKKPRIARHQSGLLCLPVELVNDILMRVSDTLSQSFDISNKKVDHVLSGSSSTGKNLLMVSEACSTDPAPRHRPHRSQNPTIATAQAILAKQSRTKVRKLSHRHVTIQERCGADAEYPSKKP